MKTILGSFLRDDDGQDQIEYALLLAFGCLASAALFIGAGQNISGIWVHANSLISTANSAAAGS